MARWGSHSDRGLTAPTLDPRTQPSAGSLFCCDRKDSGWGMSFVPCSECGLVITGKLATVYANWYDDNGRRVAWRIRYCVDCLTRLMETSRGGVSKIGDLPTGCPMCGTDSSQDLKPVWLTIYPPKSACRQYALATCSSCERVLSLRFAEIGERLPDRNAVAAATADPTEAEWSGVPW